MKRSPIKRTSWLRSKPKPVREKKEALMFPKPSQVKKEPEIEHVYRDGRTKLNQLTKAGRDEYERRKRVAWEEQKGICALCHQRLNWKDTTGDHRTPKGHGGSTHDDRQENIQAVHWECNIRKGSQRIADFDELIP